MRSKADITYAKTFGYVRRAILNLLDLPEGARTALAETQPVFNDRLRAQVHGIIDSTAISEPQPAFRNVNFTVELVDAHMVNGDLKLQLKPEWSSEFADGSMLIEADCTIYRDRLED